MKTDLSGLTRPDLCVSALIAARPWETHETMVTTSPSEQRLHIRTHQQISLLNGFINGVPVNKIKTPIVMLRFWTLNVTRDKEEEKDEAPGVRN